MSRTLLPAAALVAALAAPAAASVSFSQADMNHDGVATWDEARRAFPRLKKIHFEKCDPNGDGMITQAEFPLLSNFYWITYVQQD